MIETGTAMAGITVAETLRRKTKITRTTRITVISSVIWMSCTEARIVVVRSPRTSRLIAAGIEAHQGKRLIDPVHGGHDIGIGLPRNLDNDPALPVLQTRVEFVFIRVINVRHVAQPHRSPVVISDNQRTIVIGIEKLVIVVN